MWRAASATIASPVLGVVPFGICQPSVPIVHTSTAFVGFVPAARSTSLGGRQANFKFPTRHDVPDALTQRLQNVAAETTQYKVVCDGATGFLLIREDRWSPGAVRRRRRLKVDRCHSQCLRLRCVGASKPQRTTDWRKAARGRQ